MDTKTRPIYMLSTKDALQIERHIQNETEGMKKRYSMQMEIKRKLK